MVIWGSTFAVTRAAVATIPPTVLAVLRLVVAAVILVPLAARRGGLRALPHPLPIGTLLALGATGFTLYYIPFNYALAHASAVQGAIIQALGPAAIALTAIAVLGERPPPRRIAGIALSIVGVLLAIAATPGGAAGGANPLLGALFMLLTVVSWSAYTVLAKRLAGTDQIVVTAVITVIGAVLTAPFAMLELPAATWRDVSTEAWLGVLYLGVAASALGYVVYNWALTELDASQVAAYVNLIPIVGVAIAVGFLGETLRPWQLVGAAIAGVGMWLASRPTRATTLG